MYVEIQNVRHGCVFEKENSHHEWKQADIVCLFFQKTPNVLEVRLVERSFKSWELINIKNIK